MVDKSSASDTSGRIWSVELPDDITKLLGQLLHDITHLSTSVVLTGSWATGEAGPESDIDILVIVRGHRDRVEVQSTTPRTVSLRKFPRRMVDLKVITNEDLRTGLSDRETLAVWTQLRIGITIYGEEMRDRVRFKQEQAISVVREALNDLDEIVVWLDSHTRLTGALVKMVDILTTLYFIERYTLLGGRQSKSKSEFIRAMMGDLHDSAQRAYYTIPRKGLGGKARVRSEVDLSYSIEDYRQAAETVCMIAKCARGVYYRLAQGR